MEIYMTHEEKIIERLKTEQKLSAEELDCLLTTEDTETVEKLKAEARMAAQSVYGKQIYIRGLIEFTNYCKNDCYYCAASAGQCMCRALPAHRRSRSSPAARQGYELGFRTFVLQGGEDPYFTDEKICGLVSAIKQAYPDCAVTLSIGEKKERAIRHILTRAQTGICSGTRRRMRCTTEAAPGEMSLKTGCAVLGSKGDRLSDRMRLYGGLAVSDHGDAV